MKERLESIERQPHNLLTEPILTIEAIAAVEGPRWLAEQEGMKQGPGYEKGLANALEQLQVGQLATISGEGGKNVWFVEMDGSISFSETHAKSTEHVAKAREPGTDDTNAFALHHEPSMIPGPEPR